MRITQDLLRWYDHHKRSFAFRGTRDPYRVWVSEIMLQQTRTETVEGYYTRFFERFPDVFALAAAPEQEVLKACEGLGYYSRARNLHRAAKQVAGERAGVFPDTVEGLQALPGIGPYTAAAVASIAFDVPVPAMDGNLNRVLSRLYAVEEDIGMPSVRRRLYQLGLTLMPEDRPGDMNQALMDLGATICLPGTPDCLKCPVRTHCMAYAQGEPERLPLMPGRKPPRDVPMAVGLVTCGHQVLVFKRTQALLKGLYVFLLLEEDDSAQGLRKHLHKLGLACEKVEEVGLAKHVFTHRVWHMRLYRVEVAAPRLVAGGEWVDVASLKQLPVPTAMQAALKALEQ